MFFSLFSFFFKSVAFLASDRVTFVASGSFNLPNLVSPFCLVRHSRDSLSHLFRHSSSVLSSPSERHAQTQHIEHINKRRRKKETDQMIRLMLGTAFHAYITTTDLHTREQMYCNSAVRKLFYSTKFLIQPHTQTAVVPALLCALLVLVVLLDETKVEHKYENSKISIFHRKKDSFSQ